MAAGGPGGHAARRHAGRLAHRRGPAGPMVVVRGGDRRVHRRVGVAAARGPALMALWERLARVFGRGAPERRRSEEHTSELQSRENLVCRLLLEKKKTKHNNTQSNRLTTDRLLSFSP